MVVLIYQISIVVFALFALINLIVFIPRFRAWFGSRKPQKHVYNDKHNKIAIVIPARDESKVIGELFDSIQKQTYSQDDFDTYVIVKDPQDLTIAMAKQAGAIPLVASHQTCKGDALDYCLQYILHNCPDKYDAAVIVDADCILDEKFIEEMNNSMATGKQVLQGKRLVKNYLSNNKKANSLVSCCNGIIWTLIDDMGNRYKSDHEYTNMTIGTGVMLTMPLIKELGGWPYRKTVTEDIELMNDCAIKGITTYYNSYCKIYVEESTSLSMTNKRRTRWLKGVVDSHRIYSQQLNEIVDKRQCKDRYYVEGLWPVFRYIGSCTIFSIFSLIYALILLAMRHNLYYWGFINAGVGIGLIYLSFFIMTIRAMIVDGKYMNISFGKKVAVLFWHPIFYMGYIRIVAKAFLTPVSNRWDVIERVDFNNEVVSDDNA